MGKQPGCPRITPKTYFRGESPDTRKLINKEIKGLILEDINANEILPFSISHT